MQKKKIMAVGIALGIIFTMSFQVFAAPTIEKIQAYVNHEMNFTFDGKAAALPDGYEVIVYQDRSYVPARFVAENLGASVNWDNNTKKISFETSKGAIAPEEPQKPEENPSDKYDYRRLPLFKENAEVKMTVSMFQEDSYGKKLNVTLENKTDIPIQLDQMKTIVEADGKKYDMADATITNLDTRWYQDIRKDEKTEGYVRLPNDMKDPQKLHLEFKIRSNDSYNQVKNDTIAVDIDLTEPIKE